MSPEATIAHIARVAETWAAQAGVGGMETAGSIVSYLAKHPELIGDFLSGQACMTDWPIGWHVQGDLTWHGQDGKIHRPEFVRRQRLIKQLEKGPQP